MDNSNIKAEAIKNNFSIFLAQSFNTISPGSEYMHNWHIDLIAEKLKQIEEGKIRRLIINIPPRYLKSICVSVAWSAWILGHKPNTKIMCASYSQTLSNKHSQDCRLLMQSKWYQEIFPDSKLVRGENQKNKFVTLKRGYRFATSTGGTATGEGGDILILDDPQNPTKINSKKYRENTIEWFEKTFASRLNNKNKGAIILIMQRLHDDDLSGYLEKKKNSPWEILKLPAICEEGNALQYHESIENVDKARNIRPLSKLASVREFEGGPERRTGMYNEVHEDSSTGPTYKLPTEVEFRKRSIDLIKGEALDPKRENLQTLNNIKEELGEYNFSAQYLQKPITMGGNMIKKSWLRYFNPQTMPNFSQVIQSWDTAIKAKDGNDYSVGITIGLSGKNYYLLDVVREKLEFPELLQQITSSAQKWNPTGILIEDSSSGQSIIQVLKKISTPPIIGIRPKFDKVTRLARHTILFETGRVQINRTAQWRINFEEEILNFPNIKNDDQVDALSQGLSYFEDRTPIKIYQL